jgi:hypothetical protein
MGQRGRHKKPGERRDMEEKKSRMIFCFEKINMTRVCVARAINKKRA